MNFKKLALTVLAGVSALTLVACSAGNNSSSSSAIRVGSKDFTESLVVSEIYALALEDNGYEVERVQNISSSVIHTSIANDEIDLYPEYTGTGLMAVLGKEMETDPEVVYEIVKKDYTEQFSITWLDYAGVNNSQGLVIRTDVAKELGIQTISDLQKNADQLRFASQGEFDEREDGIAGLAKVYGDFKWKSSEIYDNSLKYQILKNDEADVAPAYTTDGPLADTASFTVLEDDKNFWPPYNLAPIVRNQVLEDKPEVAEILNKISAKLDNDAVIALNSAVDVDGKEYETVAAD